ncbi:MAG: phosphoadenylyl-sulfate reductase [Myxococcales bacterium]|nr:phosphoadenylyl-sulfate reductase [Myxococcales bacterium]
MEAQGPQEILTWAIKNFHPRLALSASFGGPEGMVLLDMMHKLDNTSRVFMLDTGRLHPATYDLVDRVRDRYDKRVEVVFPQSQDIEAMVADKGHNLFYESLENRKLCCRLRKVEPLRRYLGDFDAYVSGLRRDQNANRAGTRKVEFDEAAGGIVKLNPLADWTADEVWQYVEENQVPVNRLHAQNYPSVGCEPCTRAVKLGEDPRAGRWWWENDDTRECGIHVGEEEGGSGI